VPEPPVLDPPEVLARVLLALALILFVARLVGGLFERFGQPRVVGEIIAGILVGPTVLGGSLATAAVPQVGKAAVDGTGLVNQLYPLQVFQFLSVLGTVTLVIFMLLMGMEVEQRLLKGRGMQIVGVSAALIAVPVALGFGVGAVLDSPGVWQAKLDALGEPVSGTTHALFIAAALAVSASAALARILQERRMMNTDLGAIGMGSTTLISALMFLVLAGGVASSRGEEVVTAVGAKAALGVGLVALLFLVVRPLLARLIERRFDPEQSLDAELVAVLLLGTLLSAAVAEVIGINALVGAFVFGAAVPQVPGLAAAFVDRMQTLLVVFLVPVFLAVAGIQTDMRVLEPSLIGGILLFLVAAIACKWFLAVPVGMGLGLNWRESNALGLMLNCRGLEILIVAVVGQQLGVLTNAMTAAFMIVAVVTTLMTAPLTFAFLSDEVSEEERQKTIRDASTALLPTMTGGPRVLVAPDRPEDAVAALAGAERFIGAEGPAAQFLVVHLPRAESATDYSLRGVKEAILVPRTMQWLRPVADRLAEAGNDAEPASFVSPAPAADLARLAEEWVATDAILTDEESASALERAPGVTVHRVAPAPMAAVA
jgi:Kef-type K+ transport system membrane component KefB